MKNFFLKIGKSEIRNAVAMVYIVLALGVIYVLLFKPSPIENKDLINVLGGVMIGNVSNIINWLYGSSKDQSDAAKNDITKIEKKESE